MTQLQIVRAQLRETRAEMKARGIKRTSCFNGGLHGEVYSLNARMFALETELKTLEKNNLIESTGREMLREFQKDLKG